MAEKFLRLPEVRLRVPYSRSQIYRLVATGDFPKPYSLGARAVAWLERDIESWIAERSRRNLGTYPPPASRSKENTVSPAGTGGIW